MPLHVACEILGFECIKALMVWNLKFRHSHNFMSLLYTYVFLINLRETQITFLNKSVDAFISLWISVITLWSSSLFTRGMLILNSYNFFFFLPVYNASVCHWYIFCFAKTEGFNTIQRLIAQSPKCLGFHWKSQITPTSWKISNKRPSIDGGGWGKMEIMSGLSDKDFKAAIVKILQWPITDMLEMNEKKRKQKQKLRKKQKILEKKKDMKNWTELWKVFNFQFSDWNIKKHF